MTTLILAIVCIVLIFVLYVVSGGWKNHGGLFGIVKWMRSGARLGIPQKSPSPIRHQTVESNRADKEAIKILREIHAEMSARYSDLERRLTELETVQQEMSHSLQKMSSSVHVPPVEPTVDRTRVVADEDESATRAVEEHGLENHDKYFDILDLLDAGKSDEEIADLLSVRVDDVNYVKRLMSAPESHETESGE
ncbi:hypothetical protein [Alicyclobacillus dauci]|uniref:DUF2802 domain-containing protein n=1 Tax=Alicyclobacillus dauci TaxID=1475485 RepID=A0ABY6YZI2_9BACL|nr:hypothetical protein [Alicyclobacillus dauci]WAH35381.1 hypothetical protein NZD86_13850 [Alicyclobacillus dauci]